MPENKLTIVGSVTSSLIVEYSGRRLRTRHAMTSDANPGIPDSFKRAGWPGIADINLSTFGW